jgi:hypothetical protein
MKPLPRSPDLERIARRVIWFEEPGKALADPARFLAYAMTYGTLEDMRIVRRHVTDDELREALAHASPGIFDPRSWSYWHLMLDRFPPPQPPSRNFDGTSR